MKVRISSRALDWTEVCGTWNFTVSDALATWLESHPSCSFSYEDAHLDDVGELVSRTFWIESTNEEDLVLAKLTFGGDISPLRVSSDGC